MKCAPGRMYQNTCFTKDELICILNALYELFSIKKDTNKQTIELENELQLWDKIRGIMFNLVDIDTDNAWIYNPEIQKKIEDVCPKLYETIRYFALRPVFSGNSSGWLNDYDINLIMSQYEIYIPTLFFEGAYPCDIVENTCVTSKCQRPQAKAFKENKSWGMILNTGTYRSGGSHWTSAYQQNEESPLEYFDSQSNGKIAPSLKKTIDWLSGGKKVKVSTKYHQTDDYNCGVFSVFFLLSRAIGIPFEEFESNKISFEDIQVFRNIIFA